MSVRKYALFAMFTVLAAGTAMAQDSTAVDTTMTDTTVTDTTGDSVTALKHGVRFSELGLRIIDAGQTVSLQADGPVTFRLYDVHGRVVWAQTVQPSGGVATASWRGAVSGGRTLGRGTFLLHALPHGNVDRTVLTARKIVLRE